MVLLPPHQKYPRRYPPRSPASKCDSGGDSNESRASNKCELLKALFLHPNIYQHFTLHLAEVVECFLPLIPSSSSVSNSNSRLVMSRCHSWCAAPTAKWFAPAWLKQGGHAMVLCWKVQNSDWYTYSKGKSIKHCYFGSFAHARLGSTPSLKKLRV